MKLFKLLLCTLMFSQAAVAEELLFSGQVQGITLQPSGIDQCKRACADAALKMLPDHLGAADRSRQQELV